MFMAISDVHYQAIVITQIQDNMDFFRLLEAYLKYKNF